MSLMFSYTDDFNQPLNNWNTSNVTNMYGMFQKATNTFGNNTTIDLSNWNVQNVTDCSEFLLESNLTNIILPNFTNCSPD